VKVLVTNLVLAGRSGTEMYLRDLAPGLRESGCELCFFATWLGPLADELRALGFPVTDRLDAIPFDPDLIHGQHTVPFLTTLQRFPDRPALYLCHDAVAVFDRPPPANCVDAVDLARFPARTRIASRPARALLFTSNAASDEYARVVREACEHAGLPLDEVGPGVGRPIEAPEAVLPEYDLVFAKARCALEAMASGAAVILVGDIGLGPLVTPDNVAALRRLNFGREALTHPIDASLLRSEMERYSSDGAREVQRWVRDNTSIAQWVRQVQSFYDRVSRESAPRPPGSVEIPLELAARMFDHVRHETAHYTMMETLKRPPRGMLRAAARRRLGAPRRWLQRWLSRESPR
jgi:hypothetical protein